MAKSRRTKGGSQRYVYMKKRIAKMQRRAKVFGLLYLLATIVVTALAYLPLIIFDEEIGIKLGVMEFWTVFTQLGEEIQGNELSLAVAVIYGLMVLVLAVNLLRSIFKLGWLFKKKASRLYGLNRNMYAMEDMGKRFSSSFAAVIAFHFLIMILVAEGTLSLLMFAMFGVGVFFHFVCGIPAGNVSLFDTENGVVEYRREFGNFSPFVRNLFQFVIVVAVAYLFSGISQIRSIFNLLISENGIANIMEAPMSLVTPVLHLVMLVILIGMIYYATGTIEFDPEGPDAAGRKRFLTLSVLLLLCAGGAFAYGQFIEQTEVSLNVVLIAVIALVSVIIELVLGNCPHLETENLDEVDVGTYLTQSCNIHGAYINYPLASAPDFGGYSAMYARRR